METKINLKKFRFFLTLPRDDCPAKLRLRGEVQLRGDGDAKIALSGMPGGSLLPGIGGVGR